MNGNRFRYSYSAPDEREREEIERIRAAYRTDERAEKFSRLRRLNARVRHAATGTACALGIAGCLLFGGGMSMTLVGGNWVGGIILSACGILPMLAGSAGSTAPKSCGSPKNCSIKAPPHPTRRPGREKEPERNPPRAFLHFLYKKFAFRKQRDGILHV